MALPGQTQAAHPKISSRISAIIEQHKTVNPQAARRMAAQNGITLGADDSMVVVLELSTGSTLPPSSIASYNATVHNQYRNSVKTRIPIDQLENIADDFPQIDHIRLPLKPHPVVVSQGVNLTGAEAFQSSGYTGSGTKVAIIDAGFQYYTDAQDAGDLPVSVITNDVAGTGISASTYHGTAVAEIVYDMAPDAQLYLIKIEDDIDLGTAKNYCKTNEIDIINHSLVWFNSGPGDGTGIICDIANDAYDSGILWINSAGNHGHKHWEGLFADNDADDWHEFQPDVEENGTWANTGSAISVCLRWNDTWNNPTEDYDLYLYSSEGSELTSSQDRQNGGPSAHPTEYITHIATYTGYHYIRVYDYNTTGSHSIEVFSIDHDLELVISTGSITEPADSSKVLAVGAMFHSNWMTGPQQAYSSLGPTNDGRTKPDIMGPDGVASYTYGNFFGTSASAPHGAGAASLILCRNTAYNHDQIWQKMEQDAEDFGAPGKDNIYGAGKLSVKAVPPAAPTNLLCEDTVNPVGLTVLNPRFAWTFNDNEPGDSQSAFQLIVSSHLLNINANIADTWDSSKVVTPTTNTVYGGSVLDRGTTYYWKVRTWDGFDDAGVYSSEGSFQLLDTSAPVATVDLAASTGPVDGSILLSWTAPGDDGTTGAFTGRLLVQYATFYTSVWVSTAAQVNVSTGTILPGTTLSFSVTELTPRTSYFLGLWMSDESSNLSDTSNIVQAIANSIPSAPENFQGVGISTSGIEWTWSDTYDYEDGYYILDTSDTILVNLPMNTTYWIEISTSFYANTQYTRKAAAYAPGGVTASPPGQSYTLSNPPTNLQFDGRSPHTISLTWTPGEGGNARYAVDMSEDGTLWCSTNTKTWDDSIITNAYTYGPPLYHMTTYWFRVWGYNGDSIMTSTHTNEAYSFTTEVQNTIYTPGNGGIEIAADGRTFVQIPVGAFTSDGYIVINLDPLNNPIAADLEQIRIADSRINTKRKVNETATEFIIYNLWGLRSNENFTSDVQITIPYTDDNNDGMVDKTSAFMAGIIESTMELYVLDESARTWVAVGNQTVDTVTNFAVAYVPHFSVYILLGTAPALTLSNIAIFPNPCSVGSDLLTFVNMSEHARLRIFNLAGDMVTDFMNEEGAYIKTWDLTNLNGQKIVPGIYIYLITDWMFNDEKAVGKIAIIE